MSSIRKILVPTDFGPASEAALGQAVDLALALGAELTLLHVYESPVSFAYPGAPSIPLDDISSSLRESAEKGVRALVARTTERVAKVTGLVRQGSAWRNINDVAHEIGADLIVIGTHGRRGVPRALIGSVAEKLVRTSHVPVLTVHAQG
jgi:nucleotide-binding universal stress UspA family protein